MKAALGGEGARSKASSADGAALPTGAPHTAKAVVQPRERRGTGPPVWLP